MSGNLYKIAREISGRFNSTHVMLFVGKNCSNEELKKIASIPRKKWSAVFTTRKDGQLSGFFAKEGLEVMQYTARDQIITRSMTEANLSIFRLFGLECDKTKNEEASFLDDDEQDEIYQAMQMVDLLPEYIENVNHIVMVGMDDDEDMALLKSRLLRVMLQKLPDGTVSIWDMPKAGNTAYEKTRENLWKVAEQKKYYCCEEPFSQALSFFPNVSPEEAVKEEDESEFHETTDDIFFHNGIPVPVSKAELLQLNKSGILLTEKTLQRIRPQGRILSQQWFSNFLQAGSNEPQWYGYIPQSKFYVTRSFEEPLIKLVRNLLSGLRISGEPGTGYPVILQGDPGSSKTVALGSLAYRIFQERENPVIYIHKLDLDFVVLDETMQELAKKCPGSRILVIWDCSAFRNGAEKANTLYKYLYNRGRRFVLVCSSYNIMHKAKKECTYYCLQDKKDASFTVCDAEEAQIIEYSDDSYVVNAVRTMNKREEIEFWEIAKLYSGIPDTQLSEMKAILAEEPNSDIFNYFYKLITLLRDKLKNLLSMEQTAVTPYVSARLRDAMGKMKKEKKDARKESALYQALKAAGFDDFGEENSDEEMDAALEANLNAFNLCIAMFSQFKLSVPYGLAYRILTDDKEQVSYSTTNWQLYNLVTTEIPWLYYGKDESGDFSFHFRNSLEADIYLNTHDSDGSMRIELLCRIMDMYGQEYAGSGCLDGILTDNLQALLRLMGPNSNYPFSSEGMKAHKRVLQQLDDLIDHLSNLITRYHVPDADAGFANLKITFIREFYGRLWEQQHPRPDAMADEAHELPKDMNFYTAHCYKDRILHLADAVSLAVASIEDLKNLSATDAYDMHIANQKCSLVVENAQCSITLEKLIGEYIDQCAKEGIEPDAKLINSKLCYDDLAQPLMDVVKENPTNGYAYNALFRLFEDMYQKTQVTELRKIQYLSEIMEVVESCRTLDSMIRNRGTGNTDELSQHLSAIAEISSGMKFSIDDIIKRKNGKYEENENTIIYFELYDEMLSKNNPAMLTFLCQKEIQIPRGQNSVNTDQRMRLIKVHDFLKDSDNFECVCTNSYALALLIRVCFMIYNGTKLTPKPECQITKLNSTQWNEINELGEIYAKVSGKYNDPMIMLIYALSALQVKGRKGYGYTEAHRILQRITENRVYVDRMSTPFMVCDGDVPVQYTGTVQDAVKHRILIDNIPNDLSDLVGYRYRPQNFGRHAKLPKVNQTYAALELAIGFTSFAVYTEEGRKEKGGRA